MKLNNKKHIVILTPGFPQNEKDSVCIPPLQLFVKELARNNNVYVSVVTLHYPNKKGQYNWNRIQVYSIGALNNKFPKRFLSWREGIKAIKKIHQTKPIDVIHSFWLTDAAFVGKRVSNKLNIPHFITLMGQDVFSTNKYFKLIKPKTNQLVSLSKNQSLIFNENFNIGVKKIIPWGISLSKTSKEEKSKEIDVLAVGSLISLKNFELLINITPQLLKYKKDISIKIIGKGPQQENLQKQINELGLSNHIELLGELPNSKVLELMRTSKVLVHPSKYESFGYVFSEALSQGMQIVSFNVGIANQTDYWRVAEKESDFIPAIIDCINNKKNITGSIFDIKDTVNDYLKLWQAK